MPSTSFSYSDSNVDFKTAETEGLFGLKVVTNGKYCSVKYQTFHQVSDKTSQQTYSHQKNYLKSFPDASKSHKTSTNLSHRAYFRQFFDW